MVKLKEISRTATFAWAPSVQDPMLVTGTKAGAITADFDSTTQLEFWDLNLLDRSANSSKLDNAKVRIEVKESRFNDIAWGGQTESKPRGFVAGGHESGKLSIWDVESVLDGVTEPAYSIDKHTGPIKSLQFSPAQSRLLATAGVKGEVYVWDMKHMGTPETVGTQSGNHDEVHSVAWNNKVSYILAHGGNKGFTTVYDVRNKREALHLHYSGPAGRCPVSSVTWDPTSSTNLITASSDDGAPVVLSWDLRNASAPAVIMKGHDRGVLSVDWCKTDVNLLLSSGMDNKTILWNPVSGEALAEYPIATNWSFKSSFNDHAPDLFATASFDGKIAINTLQDTSGKDTDQRRPEGDAFWDPAAYADAQHPIIHKLQAPNWLKRPVSAQFGFGGQFVKVSTEGAVSKVTVTKVTGEDSISEDTKKFAEQLGGDLKEVVDAKIAAATSESDKNDWQIIGALLKEGSQKEKLSEFFASGNDESEKVQKKSVKKAEKAEKKKSGDDESPFSEEDGEDFLKDLSIKDKVAESYVPSGSFTLFSPEKAEKRITQAVLAGNFEKAVDICLEEDLINEAFLLALNSSEDIRNKVRNSYVAKHAATRPFVRVLNSVTSKDLSDIVENAEVAEWREIITGLYTYVDDSKVFAELCGKLGDRLLEARETAKGESKKIELRNSAVLCYIAGSNLAKSAHIWIKELGEQEKSDSVETPYVAHLKALQAFIEKVTLFRKAVGEQNFSPENLDHLYDIYREYASIVASHGQLDLAAKFFELLPADYPGLNLDKERVHQATKKIAAKAPVASSAARGIYAPSAPVVARQPPAPQARAQPAAAPYQPSAPVGGSSIYAPAIPAAPSVPAPQTNRPPQPPQAAPVSTSNSRYAAPVNPYQPVQQPQSLYAPHQPLSTPQAAAPPPPPPSGQSFAEIRKNQDIGWNDLPAAAVNAAQARRPTPSGSNTIRAPFPNQPAVFSPPPAGSNARGSAPPPPPSGRGSVGSIPPPPASASPKIGSGSTPPSSNPRYAPSAAVPAQSPNGGFNAPSFGGPPPIGHPPSQQRTISPAVNPYELAAQQSAVTPVAAPYAPGRPIGVQSPAALAPPPLMNQAHFGMPLAPPQAPPVHQQAPPPPPAAPTPPPAAPPRHPAGDRSHIPSNAEPVFQMLSQELERVRPIIPKEYTKQVRDVAKRLDILFDHLNNEELLDESTVGEMVELSTAISARDYDTAQQIHLNILTTKSEQCQQWMVGVKRLIDMGRACV